MGTIGNDENDRERAGLSTEAMSSECLAKVETIGLVHRSHERSECLAKVGVFYLSYPGRTPMS